MTTFNRRNLPHPTIKPGRNDYKDHIYFRADLPAIRRSARNEEISIALQYRLNSPVLRNLIQTGQAHYHTLTECVATKLRESHRSNTDSHTIQLDGRQYYGEIIIRPFIIASQAIENIPPDDWDSGITQLLPEGTSVPKSAILAIGSEKIADPETTSNLESYVEIIPAQTVERGRFDIDLEGQRIVIRINPGDKPDIDRMRRDENLRLPLFPSMYLRAIEQAVRCHLKDEYTDKKWANRIANKLGEHDLPTDDPEILEDRSLEYAQQIMENPLSLIINRIPSYQERES